MSDPLAPVEAQLAAVRVAGLTVRRFRRSTEGFGKRAIAWLVDEIVFGDDSAADAGEGDDPPGLEVSARVEGGAAQSFGELHPIAPEHMWVAQARVLRMAQRLGTSVAFRGAGMLSGPVESYQPVHDRMRRIVGSEEPQISAEPTAVLREMGWTVKDDGRTVALAHTQRPRPLLALLFLGLIVVWFVGVPLMFLTLLIPSARTFFRDILAGLWTMATKQERWQGHVRIAEGVLELRRPRGGESAEERVSLAEVFAVGRDFRGWSEPSSTPGQLVFWTDAGPHWFGPPTASSDRERERGPASHRALAALEGWVWTRLGDPASYR